jgi:N-carbamoylputrescine amidase
MKVTVAPYLESLCRVEPSERKPLRVALIQTKWHSDKIEHEQALETGIRLAAESGAEIVFLPELSLSRYPADTLPLGAPDATAENLMSGPTFSFAKRCAEKYNILVHASLFEKTNFADGRGLNVAILVSPRGELLSRTPKLHIPVTAGYYEDKYFAPGPNEPNPYPVYEIATRETSVKLGLPTCWDEWFPELARACSLQGAEVLSYPTAIGSEPDHPDFDTEPLWRQTIVGNAISNGLFMVVPNRYGNEGLITFYGSSFICDPFGRILVQAARSGDEVLIADLDLDQRRDWLSLFPFLRTRRPDTYSTLASE